MVCCPGCPYLNLLKNGRSHGLGRSGGELQGQQRRLLLRAQVHDPVHAQGHQVRAPLHRLPERMAHDVAHARRRRL